MGQDFCFGRALQFGAALAVEMESRGAASNDVHDAEKLALSTTPLLLWMVDGSMAEASAAGMLGLSNIGGGIVSLADWALNGLDIPLALRHALFPALRPDRHERCVRWWDDVARERWLGPMLFKMEAGGRLASLISDPLADEEEAAREWSFRHFDLWRPNRLRR